jgi:hypothetical protein
MRTPTTTKEERQAKQKEWRQNHPERMRELQRRWYEKNADIQRERAREYYAANREVKKAYARARHKAKRPELLAAMRLKGQANKLATLHGYGGPKCVCCGEETVAFLTIDHIDGCTPEQRKREGQGSALHRYLIKHNFPPGYQVLCFNCNLGRALCNGVCPHVTVAAA